jgi:hypothetical protein
LHAGVFPGPLFSITNRITNVTRFKKCATGFGILPTREGSGVVRRRVTGFGFRQIVNEGELQHAFRV